MLIYFSLYFVFIISGFLDLCNISFSKRKVILFFWVLVFTLFRGLRWETGTDWFQFFEVFKNVNWSELFSFIRYGEQKMEFGYVFLNLIVKTLGGGYTSFLIFTNAIILLIYADFSIKYSKYPLLLFIAIITASNFFPVRQTLAGAIILFSYQFVINKNLIKFLITCGIAISIHMASIVFLPFYFLLRIRLSDTILFAILFSSIFIGEFIFIIIDSAISLFSFLGSQFIERLSIYASLAAGLFDKTERSIANIVINFIFLAWFLIVRRKSDEKTVLNVFINTFVVGLAITNVFYNYMQELGRFASYFTLASSVLYTYLMDYYKNYYKFIGAFLYFLVFILLMFYRFNRLLDFYPEVHFPYQSVLDLL